MSKRYATHAFLALGLALAASPLLAGEPLKGPPWGETGASITFGDEDQGQLLFNYKAQFRLNVRDTGSGRDNDESTANLGFRRNRVALRGGWGEKISLYVQTEFVEDPNLTTLRVSPTNLGTDFQLLDAVVRFDLHPAFKVNVGKFKYNLSRENLEDCLEPLTLDRSLFIRTPFVATRDLGVAVWGNLFKDRFQYRLDAMEGRSAVAGETAPASRLRFSGRAHVTLLDPENGYGYRGTYLGDKRVLTVGGAYQFEPDVTYTDVTTRFAPRDYKAWTVDGFFEYPFADAGMVTLSGAYEKADLGGAYQGASPDPGAVDLYGEKNGWYGKAAYLLPNLPVQVFGRFEKWRFASLDNAVDQIVDWFGVGANFYVWRQNLKITAEFQGTRYDKQGTFTSAQGTSLTSKNFNTFVTQLQFVF
jgi:hypothetical protein